jgi:hypothetical protein
MKISVLNIHGVQTTVQGKTRYYYLVENDYDFTGNSATDVTSYVDLKFMHELLRYSCIQYRDSLRYQYEVVDVSNWDSLDDIDKRILALNNIVDYEKITEILSPDEIDTYFVIYDAIKDCDLVVNTDTPPFDIDFTLLGLHRVPINVAGELSSVTYYMDVSVDSEGNKSYSNPCVEKNVIYIRSNGYLFQRISTIYWYKKDGSKCAMNDKVVNKYYNNKEAIEGGKRQRDYIIDSMLIDVVGLLTMTEVYCTGTTTNGTTGTRLEDTNRTFNSDYIGRTLVIGSDTWSVVSTGETYVNVTGDTLIAGSGGQSYIFLYSIIDADKRGASYMAGMTEAIDSYIKGSTDQLIDSVSTTDDYYSGITYNYPYVVDHSDVTYKCITNNVTGSWDQSKWEFIDDHTWLDNIIPGTGGTVTIRIYILSKLNQGVK